MLIANNPYRKANIREIDVMLGGGEDPRQSNTGIFKECTGTLPETQYLEGDITVLGIQEDLLNYYEFDEIAYQSWQEFFRRFTNVWNLEFPVFRQNLMNAQEFTILDSTETLTETSTGETNSDGTSAGDARYTDTPSQYLTSGNATENGLTSYQKNSGHATNNSNYTTKRESEHDKGGNKFERWLELSAENRNIITDFYNKFRNLFSTTMIFF